MVLEITAPLQHPVIITVVVVTAINFDYQRSRPTLRLPGKDNVEGLQTRLDLCTHLDSVLLQPLIFVDDGHDLLLKNSLVQSLRRFSHPSFFILGGDQTVLSKRTF